MVQAMSAAHLLLRPSLRLPTQDKAGRSSAGLRQGQQPHPLPPLESRRTAPAPPLASRGRRAAPAAGRGSVGSERRGQRRVLRPAGAGGHSLLAALQTSPSALACSTVACAQPPRKSGSTPRTSTASPGRSTSAAAVGCDAAEGDVRGSWHAARQQPDSTPAGHRSRQQPTRTCRLAAAATGNAVGCDQAAPRASLSGAAGALAAAIASAAHGAPSAPPPTPSTVRGGRLREGVQLPRPQGEPRPGGSGICPPCASCPFCARAGACGGGGGLRARVEEQRGGSGQASEETQGAVPAAPPAPTSAFHHARSSSVLKRPSSAG